jgi:hypothetical protein
MAEEPPEIGPTQGHAIETQAFMLDLYRLVCMVSADQPAAKYALTSDAIETLQSNSVWPQCDPAVLVLLGHACRNWANFAISR